MLINKVVLKNYRSHTDTTVEFSTGINLVLGQNGAGKSSILEAIGFTLYDAGLRTTQKEAVNINNDSSHALIKVVFTANDDTVWSVERKLGSTSSHNLYAGGETQPRKTGTNEVVSKVKELTGIDLNAKNIYENLVSCYQNKIVNIFSDSPAERKKTFDRIFNTDNYDKIQKESLKKLEDSYSNGIGTKNAVKAEKASKLVSEEELGKRMNDLCDSLEENKKVKAGTEEKRSGLVAERDRLLAISSKIAVLDAEKKNSDKQLAGKDAELRQAESDIKQAETAVAILKSTFDGYTEYKRIRKEFDEKDRGIALLEKKDKDRQAFEKDHEKLLKSEAAMTADRNNTEKALSDLNEAIALSQNTNENKQGEVEADAEKIAALDSEKTSLQRIFDDFNGLHGSYKNVKKLADDDGLMIAEKEKSRIDVQALESATAKHIEEKAALEQMAAARIALSNEMNTIQTRMKDNDAAAKKLSTGVCPYLKDECLNIREKGSSLKYFENIKNELAGEQKKIADSLKQYEGLDERLRSLEKEINTNNNLKKQDEENANQIAGLKADRKLKEKDLEILSLKIGSVVREFDESYAPSTDYESVSAAISTRLNSLKADFQSAQSVLTTKENELKRLREEHRKLKEKLEETGKKRKELAGGLESLNEKKQELGKRIAGLTEELKDFEELKNMRADLKSQLDTHSDSYNKYLANEKKAGELDSLKERALKIQEDINGIRELAAENEEKRAGLNREFSPVKLDSIKSEISLCEEALNRVAGAISSIETEIRHTQDTIAANRKLREEIDDVDKEIKYLTKKCELTGLFRKNLGNLGKIVASRLIGRIELAATENYRNISGRGEQIRWVIDNNESYAVYLDNGKARRRFEILSGGEQVAVALSIRAAMSSIFTKANFTIFDEPTINLDTERRAALAESLNKILSNLEQAIIVTHDGTFREMAGKIIEL